MQWETLPCSSPSLFKSSLRAARTYASVQFHNPCVYPEAAACSIHACTFEWCLSATRPPQSRTTLWLRSHGHSQIPYATQRHCCFCCSAFLAPGFRVTLRSHTESPSTETTGLWSFYRTRSLPWISPNSYNYLTVNKSPTYHIAYWKLWCSSGTRHPCENRLHSIERNWLKITGGLLIDSNETHNKAVEHCVRLVRHNDDEPDVKIPKYHQIIRRNQKKWVGKLDFGHFVDTLGQIDPREVNLCIVGSFSIGLDRESLEIVKIQKM